MLARNVAARLKPNALAAFSSLMEREILPWLRQQEGFLDLITLAAPDGSEVATITFWDHEGSSRACSSCGYPETLKVLGELLDGTPHVKTFEVVSSTFQKTASRRPPADSLIQETGSAQLGYRAFETGI